MPNYLNRASSSPFVRLSSAYELQTAAAAEIRKYSTVTDAEGIYSDAKDAIDALETLLGQEEWFFGKTEAGLFDAAVFAYTQLLLDDEQDIVWKDERLRSLVLNKPGLVQHQKRIYEKCYV